MSYTRIVPQAAAVALLSLFLGADDVQKPNAATTTGQRPEHGQSSQQPKPSEKPIDPARLAERDRLGAQAQQLHAAGKLREAIAALEKTLAIERELFGNDHEEVLGSLDLVATWCLEQDDLVATGKYREEILATKTKLLGRDHWQVIDARLAVELVRHLSKLDATQRRQLQEAENAVQKAAALRDAGRIREAVGLESEALQIRKAILGEGNPLYGLSLNNLATLLHGIGQYDRAESLYLESLRIRKAALGEEHPDCGRSLTNLALLYQAKRGFAQAEPLLQQALEIARRAFGESHPEYAECLTNLAELDSLMGRYEAAERLFKQALRINRDAGTEETPQGAVIRHCFGDLYRRMGRYAEAEVLYDQALHIRKMTLGEGHIEYAQTLNNLAGLYHAMGESARAEPMYRQALETTRHALGEGHRDYATCLGNVGLFYWSTGQYTQAEPLLRQSLEIRRKTIAEAHPLYAEALNNLALLYKAMGQYENAEPLYKQAMEIQKKVLGEKHPSYATTLSNLALLCQRMGQNTQAERLLKQAVAIDANALGEGHPAYAKRIHNLALIYQAQSQYLLAESHYKQALTITRKALGEEHPDYAATLENLALLKIATDEPVESAALSSQAANIIRRYIDRTAAIQSERQQLAMARKSRTVLDGYLSATLAAETPAEEVYLHLEGWKGAVTARQQAMRRLRNEIQTEGNAEARQTMDKLVETTRELARLTNYTPSPEGLNEHHQRLEELNDRLERLEQKLSATSEAFRNELQRRAVGIAELRRALPSEAVLVDFFEYAHYGRNTGSGSEPICQPRVAAFIIRSGTGAVQRLDLGPVTPMAEAVERWRKSFDPQDSAAIRRLVWDKLPLDVLNARTVLVSPDGVLARFPWGALPGNKRDTYLIEEQAVAQVAVPRMLPELLTPKAASSDGGAITPTLLLVGNVDFGADPGTAQLAENNRSAPRSRERGAPWSPLPGTAREIEAVESIFRRHFHDAAESRIRQLGGIEPTEQQVRRLAPQNRYLHFATHAFFAPSDAQSVLASQADHGINASMEPASQAAAGYHPGLLSGLVLAGANRPIVPEHDDGIITALEVASLDLSRVELAVLSACETGLGETAGGEGLLGLQRAFQIAGARTTVASLWKVHDDATRVLMTEFYGNLWQKKLGRIEALRQAQLTVLRHYDAEAHALRGLDLDSPKTPADVRKAGQRRGAEPQFWAAFVLSGDWR